MPRGWRRRNITGIIHFSRCICRFALGFCKNKKERTETLYHSFSPFMVPVAGVEPARVISPTDFELFASHRIQTNSTPYGGRRRTPKSPQLLTILKLMCKKAPFRLPFPYFSILTGILDFGGTSEGCNPKTEHNSTRNRFIKHKHIIACSSAIDNIFFKKEVSL